MRKAVIRIRGFPKPDAEDPVKLWKRQNKHSYELVPSKCLLRCSQVQRVDGINKDRRGVIGTCIRVVSARYFQTPDKMVIRWNPAFLAKTRRIKNDVLGAQFSTYYVLTDNQLPPRPQGLGRQRRLRKDNVFHVIPC